MKAETPSALKDAVATAEALFSLGLSEASAVSAGMSDEARTRFGKALCTAVLERVWNSRARQESRSFALRPPPCAPCVQYPGLVQRLAEAFRKLDLASAGFFIGQLYTALLPSAVRKALGAFYTPPTLVTRLLELVTASGFDWSSGRIVDPACGGAAFLASIAPVLVKNSRHRDAGKVLCDIEERLCGIEVDPFAAWMSMVLLDLALSDLATAAGRTLKAMVKTEDALKLDPASFGPFDLVIGNPPYGKVTLAPSQRQRFRESLFGHANLYGVFTELAVRLCKAGGIIAYVTPTSFLGGEYFKNLRKLLETQAPLERLDFVSDRNRVFDGVLQETMLALYRRQEVGPRPKVQIHVLRGGDEPTSVRVERVGSAQLDSAGGKPWLLPRSPDQVALLKRLNSMPHRLADYGFQVSTGQLVWNRHKEQLRAKFEEGFLPIIWAEAVQADGRFRFQAARKFHLPYLEPRPSQEFLVNQEPCILVQRTTAKEQKRRIIATVLPNSFLLEYPGFVVENHLNMIYARASKPPLALQTLAALLNSSVLDQAFRCINGSVAVSAYELNSLPLPNEEQMRSLQDSILAGGESNEIDSMLTRFYSQNGTDTTASRPRSDHRKMAA